MFFTIAIYLSYYTIGYEYNNSILYLELFFLETCFATVVF